MTTKVPNSMLESPGGGSGSPVPVTPTTYVILLNVTGSGIAYTNQKIVDANSVLSVDLGSQVYGNAWVSYVGDGVHTLGYGPFKEQNGYAFNNGLGQLNCYTLVKDPGGNFLAFGYAGDTVGATQPTLLAAAVSDTDPRKVHLTWSRSMNPMVSAAAAFAVSSAHAIVGHNYVDATHSDLVLASSFISSESAKTLAYTQPGSNKMQDLSANLVANFSGVAIANNVVTPTLLSLIVSNASPDKLDATWSKAMDPASISAFGNFAVNLGHALSAHTYVDATHTQFTTATPFVGGETKTFAYTPSGTNDMKDLAGGNLVQLFSGFTITDNVSTGTIFEDDLRIPLSGSISAHAPNVANPNTLAWVDHTAGNDAFLGGSLKMGEIVGSPYAVDGVYLAVPSAISLLEFTFLCTTGTSPNVSQADIYVRDTGIATAAALTGYRFRVDPELGNITVNQITAGSVGSTLATLTSTAWASNAISKLGLAFTVNSVQVKVNDVNVGSPVTVSGSNNGIRLAATGRGAHGVYATYAKAI